MDVFLLFKLSIFFRSSGHVSTINGFFLFDFGIFSFLDAKRELFLWLLESGPELPSSTDDGVDLSKFPSWGENIS